VPGTFLLLYVKVILRLLFMRELLYHSYRTVGMNDVEEIVTIRLAIFLENRTVKKEKANEEQVHEGAVFYLFAPGGLCAHGTGVPEEGGYLCDWRLWVDGALHRSGWECYN
jgi:hypothetical protein